MRHLLIALLVAAPLAAHAQLRVIDGDTVMIDGETVRIEGLDAPELRGQCQAEIELGRAAAARLAELLAGGYSVEPHGLDRYRRRLAILRDAQGRNVAEVLVAEGLARAYHGRGARQGWC
jgi:micrococcal nuclease